MVFELLIVGIDVIVDVKVALYFRILLMCITSRDHLDEVEDVNRLSLD